MKIFNVMPDIYYIISFGILGLFFGSFFNVVGYRLPKNKSIVKPGSSCPNCNHKLKPIELIPIISYIIQRGKCTKCNAKIPIIYPASELITALLFAFTFYKFGFQVELLYSLILISGLLIIINSDIRYMIIPNKILLATSIPLLIIDLINLPTEKVGYKVFAGAIMFAILLLIKQLGNYMFKEESLGDGDIKLMALIGYVLGVTNSITTVFLGSAVALIVAITILKKGNKKIIAFGPFLAGATIIMYLTNINILEILTKV